MQRILELFDQGQKEAEDLSKKILFEGEHISSWDTLDAVSYSIETAAGLRVVAKLWGAIAKNSSRRGTTKATGLSNEDYWC